MNDQNVLRHLIDLAGRTYAEEAGITLRDKPSPLYRLLVLSTLLSTRIKAGIAVDAARELSHAKLTTARAMADSTWQDRVDALGRAHYKRYDEQTATALGEGAQQILDDYAGDLRRLRAAADDRPTEIRARLRALPRVGPVGADIFCREAQAIWPELRPYLDKKALDGAKRIGLPADPDRLARLATKTEPATLAAALVRVALDAGLAKQLT